MKCINAIYFLLLHQFYSRHFNKSCKTNSTLYPQRKNKAYRFFNTYKPCFYVNYLTNFTTVSHWTTVFKPVVSMHSDSRMYSYTCRRKHSPPDVCLHFSNDLVMLLHGLAVLTFQNNLYHIDLT